ncbi:hypothetical protein cyc_02392 [Cyclospora cayetanensis]|uniref:Uncharacterized protein n=1 Tax=Cyclospora cayetanensis TaxID=88456 RepID=A0A1D3CZT7_9EIME|nr:hypothetical protein cyc_02392 [Cyclospora cayetanensis]
MSPLATLFCGILVVCSFGEPYPTLAAQQKLQRAHPRFGKCTADDFSKGFIPAEGLSFLQDGESSMASDDCMQMAAEQNGIFSSAIDAAETRGEEDDIGITDTSTGEEVVARAVSLLKKDSPAGSTHCLGVQRRIRDQLARAAQSSTIFVLGLGPELYALSQLATNVIAVETDHSICKEFLNSNMSACAMQTNVHIYCSQPNSSPDNDAQLIGGGQSSFEATKALVDDLVQQQFGGIPVSTLVVLGRYPVAKLLLMWEHLDQSSVIVTRSRMPAKALAALNGLIRVVAYLDPRCQSSSQSIASILLMQKMFSPPINEELWMNYVTPEWELEDNKAPLQLVATAHQAVESLTSEESLDPWKRRALSTYLNVHAQAARRASDEDWPRVKTAIDSVLDSAGRGKKIDDVLAVARGFATQVAQAAAISSGLQAYLQLLLATLAKQGLDSDSFVHSVICELILEAESLISSTNILDMTKDAIEEACETAEKNKQLFLPGLRLIQEGLSSESSMGQILQLLLKLRDLGPEVDVSALIEMSKA